MRLKVLLPFRVYVDKVEVLRVVAETNMGSMGLLPHRLDCVAALMPGILTYQTQSDGEIFLAVDQGVLVKIGDEITVSVRHASRGTDLASLRQAVERDFLSLDARQKSVSAASEKLESGFVSRFASLNHD